MQSKFELDHDHPCLACGAPWRVRRDAVMAGAEIEDWRSGPGECLGGCVSHDLAAYNRGLEERHKRGW